MRRQPPSEPGGRKSRGGRGASETTNRVPPGDDALYQALKALRLRLAAEGNLPPYVICHDRTLLELAQKRPSSEAALGDIIGMGARKVARYGVALLEVIGRFKRHPMLDNRLSATVNQTLALHLDGLDAEAIAQSRSVEVSTVQGHFAEAIEAGLLEARAVIGLEEDEIEEILAVFERLGTVDSGKLGPAHAALDGQYNYGVLKCLLAEVA